MDPEFSSLKTKFGRSVLLTWRIFILVSRTLKRFTQEKIFSNFVPTLGFLMFQVKEEAVFESYGYPCGYFMLCKFSKCFHNCVLSHIKNTLLFLNLDRGADTDRFRLVALIKPPYFVLDFGPISFIEMFKNSTRYSQRRLFHL